MIYKYYAFNNDNKDCLEQKYFWFSKHQLLNDPFDMAGDFFKRFPSFFGNPSFQDTYETLINNMGLCCFSNDPLNKHLWALYADKYKGFVLAFEDDDFVNYYSEKMLAKVIYSDCIYLDQLPDFIYDTIYPTSYLTDDDKNIIDAKGDPKKLDELFTTYLLYKDKRVWSEENEKRMILGGNFISRIDDLQGSPDRLREMGILDVSESGYKIAWKDNSLKEIYFGHNMKSSCRSEIEALLPHDIVKKIISPIYEGVNFELELKDI